MNLFYKTLYLFLKKLKFNSHINNLRGLLYFLQSKNMQINTILDVGAFKGEWSKYVQRIFPKSTFVLVEPNIAHNSVIEAKGFLPFNELFSNERKEVVFYSSNTSGDSCYLEVDQLNSYTNTRRITTITIDEFFKLNNLPTPDLIKLDVQGSELDVLRGAIRTIIRCKIVILELPVIPYNLGAPSFTEVTSHMISRGFVPFYLCEVHKVGEVLVQVDIAFLKNSEFEKLFGKLEERGFWQTVTMSLEESLRASRNKK